MISGGQTDRQTDSTLLIPWEFPLGNLGIIKVS